MLVYFDICAIQRPLDDASQLRVQLEAEAVLGLLADARVRLLASDVHYIETRRNPHPNRRDYALEVLSLAETVVPVTDRVSARAAAYVGLGIKPADALHLAAAVEHDAEVFCTTDDALYKKARRADTRATRVVTPLELTIHLSQS